MTQPTLLNGTWPLILPEHRQKFWTEQHSWEAERLAHMAQRVEPGDKVLYIGAEEGDMPALAVSWGAETFLVEPGKRVWANIKACYELNEFAAPHGCYVGFAGKADSANSADGFDYGVDAWPRCADGPLITDHGFPALTSSFDLPVITVDTIAQAFVPDFLVMDVEGAEWDVLAGAEQTLLTHKPKIYLSGHPEFMFHGWNKYMADVRCFLLDRGYAETLIAYPLHELHWYYEPR